MSETTEFTEMRSQYDRIRKEIQTLKNMIVTSHFSIEDKKAKMDQYRKGVKQTSTAFLSTGFIKKE